jgi:cyclic pyranopterin phosphate synthase
LAAQGAIMTQDTVSHHLTHVDQSGKALMVDVTAKAVTMREAEARGELSVSHEALKLIRENAMAKGDVFGVARVAAIMAAKRTADLIPLCHSIPLSSVEIELAIDEDAMQVTIVARVRTEGKTGVEMEALTAVALAALTIYDMCKAVDRTMTIERLRLTRKTGGKSGTFERE